MICHISQSMHFAEDLFRITNCIPILSTVTGVSQIAIGVLSAAVSIISAIFRSIISIVIRNKENKNLSQYNPSFQLFCKSISWIISGSLSLIPIAGNLIFICYYSFKKNKKKDLTIQQEPSKVTVPESRYSSDIVELSQKDGEDNTAIGVCNDERKPRKKNSVIQRESLRVEIPENQYPSDIVELSQKDGEDYTAIGVCNDEKKPREKSSVVQREPMRVEIPESRYPSDIMKPFQTGEELHTAVEELREKNSSMKQEELMIVRTPTKKYYPISDEIANCEEMPVVNKNLFISLANDFAQLQQKNKEELEKWEKEQQKLEQQEQKAMDLAESLNLQNEMQNNAPQIDSNNPLKNSDEMIDMMIAAEQKRMKDAEIAEKSVKN